MAWSGLSRPSPAQRKKLIKGNYAKKRPVSAEPWVTSAWSRRDDCQDWVFNSETLSLRPQWSDRHSVPGKNQNAYLPHSQRRYFDDLPNAKLQPRPKPRRVQPTMMECARWQAVAFCQAEAVDWKSTCLLQPDQERRELLKDPSVAAEPEKTVVMLAAEAEHDNEEFGGAKDARRTIMARKSIAVSSLEKASHATGVSGGKRGTVAQTRARLARSNTVKGITVEDRRVVLEQQVMEMYDATTAIPSLQPFADFYMWCIQKFSNLTRCWRLLDTSLNMKLSYLEFLTSLRKYDFSGDARLIFRILDRDRSSFLAYYHFDPNGAVELAQLKAWATKTFGSVQAAFQGLDENEDGTVDLEEFREGAKLRGFEGDEALTHIFEMLDLSGDRKVVCSEIQFLDQWDCPPWLMAAPDFTGAQEFKRRLLQKHRSNAIIAWYFGLDQEHHMRISWYEFADACKRENLMGDQLPGIWRALDTNLSGWLSLHEFDPDVYKLLVDFKRYCQKYGGIKGAMPILDKNENSVVSKREFFPVVRDMGLQEWEGDTLWTGLELNGDGSITKRKIEYLDKWNVDDDSREEEFWQVVADCLTTKHKTLSQ